MLYLDTSALLKLYIRESGSEAVHRMVTSQSGCRTMDILHVAIARQLEPDQFLSFDSRQRKLAAQAGLIVPELA